MHWNGEWHMGGMWLLWILFVVAIVAVVWLAAATARRAGAAPSDESPEQALKRRYAKGEIDKETYERMLTDLKK